MKQAHRFALLFALAVCAGAVFSTGACAERGTFIECVRGCPAESQQCRDCCADTFYKNKVFNTCRSSCDENYNKCVPRCALIKEKKSTQDLCYAKCFVNREKCFKDCDATKLEFTCPDWKAK